MANPSTWANTPSISPPPGVTPNFINPHSREKWVIICAAVCLFSSSLFVGARMFTKSVITKSLDWSDYTCCIAWAGLIVDCTLGLKARDYGFGRHQWDVPNMHIPEFLKLLYAMDIIFAPLIFFAELSILLLYASIFVVNRRSTTSILIQMVLWTNFFFYIAMTLACIFTCSPINKYWHPNIPGYCAPPARVILAAAIFNVVSNVVTVILPLHAIWQLQMPTRKKIGASAVFMAGVFACFGSIMRLQLTVRHRRSPDVTYSMLPVILWTVGEVATGIICGCLPILPQFIHYSTNKFSSLTSRKRNSRYISHPSSSLPMREAKPRLLQRPNSLDPESSESVVHLGDKNLDTTREFM